MTGLFGDETSTSDAETGFSHTDSKDVPGSQHLTRRAASSANTVRSLALLSHDPLVYGPELICGSAQLLLCRSGQDFQMDERQPHSTENAPETPSRQMH